MYYLFKTFIDGLVKTRSRSLLIDLSQLELEKVINKSMILLWSLEAYPDLITGINPEDRSQIKGFVEKKLSDFAKGEDICFSPDIFMKALRKTSGAGMSESYFVQRDRIIEPFKVKIIKDEEVISRRKKIINGLISEIKLNIHVAGKYIMALFPFKFFRSWFRRRAVQRLA